MKTVKFVEQAIYNEKVFAEVGEVKELENHMADRWIKRSKAIEVEAEVKKPLSGNNKHNQNKKVVVENQNKDNSSGLDSADIQSTINEKDL